MNNWHSVAYQQRSSSVLTLELAAQRPFGNILTPDLRGSIFSSQALDSEGDAVSHYQDDSFPWRAVFTSATLTAVFLVNSLKRAETGRGNLMSFSAHSRPINPRFVFPGYSQVFLWRAAGQQLPVIARACGRQTIGDEQ